MKNLPNPWLNFTFVHMISRNHTFLDFLGYIHVSSVASLFSLQTSDQVQDHFSLGPRQGRPSKSSAPAGRVDSCVSTSLASCSPDSYRPVELSSWSSAGESRGWWKTQAGQERTAPSLPEHLPEPVTSPDMSGRGSVWCLPWSLLFPSWKKLHVPILWD